MYIALRNEKGDVILPRRITASPAVLGCLRSSQNLIAVSVLFGYPYKLFIMIQFVNLAG